MGRLGAAVALLLFLPTAARAEERILRYLSDVRVQRDGSLDVTETIDVRAENNAINHGIYRDFPTRYRGRHGNPIRVGFKFDGATLDGKPVPAATDPLGNGVRIKVGDPETYVSVGEHSYVLRYRTTRQIGRFADFDAHVTCSGDVGIERRAAGSSTSRTKWPWARSARRVTTIAPEGTESSRPVAAFRARLRASIASESRGEFRSANPIST